jgi:hypothetical protein
MNLVYDLEPNLGSPIITVMLRAINKIQNYKWWQFGLIFLMTLPLTAYLLRQNNLQMLRLRDAVVEIDQTTGDIAKIEPALTELRDYVMTHMNATLPAPLELQGSFNNAVERARKQAEQSGQADGGIYRQAQAECERPEIPLSVRAECIQNYVISNAEPGSEPQQLDIPPKEQFTYNFVSPRLSIDLAGLATVISLSLLLLTLTKFSLDYVVPKISNLVNKKPL